MILFGSIYFTERILTDAATTAVCFDLGIYKPWRRYTCSPSLRDTFEAANLLFCLEFSLGFTVDAANLLLGSSEA
jgi:hypothetical protein